eukprot:GHVU01087414.1.p1 GENE.GHVU01087414.1~~GHVU01087414.1.p1  ORF type:complete len:164 (-),score=22.72 GHVU01087414.1:556-1047(-)
MSERLFSSSCLRLGSVYACMCVYLHVGASGLDGRVVCVRGAAADAKSWKVRYAAIEGVEQVGAYATGPEVKEKLVAHFVDVLRQGEPELRSAAVSRMWTFARAAGVLDAKYLNRLQPCLDELASDGCHIVRVDLAEHLMTPASGLDHETITRILLSPYLRLLR